MNRYRPARRTSQGNKAGPLIAFMLIACFGILFAGCNAQVTPKESEKDDVVFTEEDVARFQELARTGTQPDVTGEIDTAGGTEGSLSSGPTLITSSSASSLPVLDMSMAKTYDSARSESATQATNVFRVTNPTLNVRAQPSVGAALVAKLKGGDSVTVVEITNGEWAKITTPDGKEGYASVQYLSKVISEEKRAEEEAAFANLYYVNYKFLNMRKEPNQGSEKIAEIPGLAFVKPLSMEGGWAKVEYGGKQGFVSTQYLQRFTMRFVSRQESFRVPILNYSLSQAGMADTLVAHAKRLSAEGFTLMSLRNVYDAVLAQEKDSSKKFEGKNVVVAVSGVTGANVKQVSDLLYGNRIPATLFIATKNIGMSGITEKQMLTLKANGFDIQSNGHTGDDLRSLSNAQVTLEVQQSRKMIEDLTNKPVYAIAYPQGGANERVMQAAKDAGYLFGIEERPGNTFTRSQFLQVPSITVANSVTPDQIVTMVQ
jgi:uncharacterized protein YgiM (DUF1202 family)/peptidoglycan/xylan/chitin deacetylase (PgdA/CDA1 family)